ncbi:MAG: hypothetical protein Tsb0020_27740 [Haliangiales bacterium]
MSSATRTEASPAGISGRLVGIIGALLLAGGFVAILSVYRWHVTAPVVMLCLGWIGILYTVRTLLMAGLAAAEDTGESDSEGFWKPVGVREELLREKRSLLKAIKEIEFDHAMGKMSDADAEEIARFYRNRAIEIIKALETDTDDASLPVDERIAREVKARVAVAKASAKGKRLQAQKASREADDATVAATQAAEAASEAAEAASEAAEAAEAAAEAAAVVAEAEAADIDRAEAAEEAAEAEAADGDGAEAEGADAPAAAAVGVAEAAAESKGASRPARTKRKPKQKSKKKSNAAGSRASGGAAAKAGGKS